MDKSKWGVHEHHCCVLHGCKYGYEDCPVAKGETTQEYTCEYCSDDGVKNVWQVGELIYIKNRLKLAKDNCDKNITVTVDFLDRMLNQRY